MALSVKVWAIFGVLAVVLVGATVFFAIHPLKLSELNSSNQSTEQPMADGKEGQPSLNKTQATESPNTSSAIYVEPLIYSKFQDNETWVRVIVGLKENGVVQSVISSIPENEFKLDTHEISETTFGGEITENALSILTRNPYVSSVHYAPKVTLQLDSSVSLINVNPYVWNLSYAGATQTVCVIDSGIDYLHPSLGSCFGNGTDFSCKVIAGYDFYNYDGNPIDDQGHGTHVAGIISSSNITYRGVAYDSKLVAMKACGGSCSNSAMNESMEWCLNHSADYNISVISMSIGEGGEYPPSCPTLYNATVKKAADSGIAVVVASGNEGHKQGISWPACLPGAISVGAVYDEPLGNEPDNSNWNGSASCQDINTTPDDIICFTNRGSNLSLLAPGCKINSTNYSSSDVRDLCGTSMATPHVSGSIALLLQFKDDLTPNQLRDILNITGKEISDSGHSNLSFKRIDVLKAIMAVNASLLQVPSVTEIYSNDTRKIYDFRILDANLSHIENISWQAILENGTLSDSTINFSVTHKQFVIVLFEQNFSNRGISDINFSARADNLFYSRNYTAQAGDLFISQFNDLNTSGPQKIYEFRISTNKTSNVTGINWSFDYGDEGNVSANQLFGLQPGKEILVIVQRNYAGFANRIINATVFSAPIFAEKIKYLTYLNISDLSVLNASNRYRIFGFNITNLYFKNLTGVFWNASFGDGGERNVTQPLTIGPNETAFALFDYNYSAAGNYTINVNLTNTSIVDKKSINISVT